MNKVWKVLLPLVLVMALLTASLPAFAAESPTTKAIGTVKVSAATYNGKKQTPTVKVYDTTGARISSRYYKVKVAGTPKNAGKYKVTVTAKAPYTGTKTANFVINKAKNPFTIKAGKTTFKRNTTKNQTTSIKVTGAKGVKLGKWLSTSPNVYVKGGKIVVRKGFYGSAILSIATLSTANYKYTRKYIRITVKK
ncbi:MAG: hypothetical protein IJI83_04995 [Oscillospiraceae bacterium]|nr:hypothetical protein [Oscillospiraceae bacterium]